VSPIARIAIFVAGLAARFIWPYVFPAFSKLLPEATTLVWRVFLAISGMFCALALVGALVFIAPPV